MSVENVRAFYDKVAERKDLQRQLTALDEGSRDQDEAMAGLVKIAAEEGFEFEAADFIRARNEAVGKTSSANEITGIDRERIDSILVLKANCVCTTWGGCKCKPQLPK